MTAATKAGQVVVDAKGMSVYFFTKDTKDSGTSACTGSCIAAWPPVLAGSDAPAVEGITGKVGTIATPDAKKQLTINGMRCTTTSRTKPQATSPARVSAAFGIW